MKVFAIITALFISIAIVLIGISRIRNSSSFEKQDDLRVLVVYDPILGKPQSHILQAYQSVLQEEGVPNQSTTPSLLLSSTPENIVRTSPVIIFPDGIAQYLPEDLEPWIDNYLGDGGNIMVVYDPGTRDLRGRFQSTALFSELTGVNYITYDLHKDETYTTGSIRFKDLSSANAIGITPGKLSRGLQITGYDYGVLKYPVQRNEPERKIDRADVYAYAVASDGKEYPGVVISPYQSGNVMYVNWPLGFAKLSSDDMPLRSILRSFLFRVVKIPHLMNTPSGKGGLVINWHVDSKIEWKNIPKMIAGNYLRKALESSIHITAGDFRDKPGDNMGFRACDAGKLYVPELMRYGTLGSHGGWAHNWFAKKLEAGELSPDEIEHYVRKNSDCLARVAGYKITEYSSPVGVHPQPVMTDILDRLGFVGYYYTGDTGSGPNRTFTNGGMVSSRVIAFPIVTLEDTASLYEMKEEKKSQSEIQGWLLDLLSYSVQNRVTRLYYSHLIDIRYYPDAVKAFLDRAELLNREGKLQVRSMTYFARFYLRFLKTTPRFRIHEHSLDISLSNPEGLQNIALAVPKDVYAKPSLKGMQIDEDQTYYYITYEGSNHQVELHLPMSGFDRS